jgi:lysozyme
MIATICYGHTDGVKLGDWKSDPECLKILETDVQEVNRYLDTVVLVTMSEPRRAALISFVYNVGPTRFRHSTLLRKLNQGDYSACSELRKWVYAKGKKLPGLVKRREIELQYCLGGY